MGSNDKHQLDWALAERTWGGGTAVAGHLGDVLAAASAPAEPDELIGEDAAVAMFHAARTRRAARPHRHQTRTTAVKRLLTAKFAVVTVVISVGVGGVAVAASTGNLPIVSHHPISPTASSTGITPRHPVTVSTTNKPRPSATTTNPAAPSTSLSDLCHAYTAAVTAGHTPASDTPAFARLIAAAGGATHVAAYCRALLTNTPNSIGTPTPADKKAKKKAEKAAEKAAKKAEKAGEKAGKVGKKAGKKANQPHVGVRNHPVGRDRRMAVRPVDRQDMVRRHGSGRISPTSEQDRRHPCLCP